MDIMECAKNVLEKESMGIEKVINKLDGSFKQSALLMSRCKGKVITTGIGKSGLIARKISATLSSTGTSSFFVHPTEAKHGDLGMYSEGDICLAISNSGETKELLEISPILKKQNIPIISITKNSKNSLANQSTYNISTYVDSEACPLNLVPTTSSIVTLAIGDALAIAIMELNEFREEDFALRHPGGSLGKKLLYKVKDCMKNEIPKVDIEASLKDVLIENSLKKLGMVTVFEGANIKGIITDGDIRRAIEKNQSLELKAVCIMTENPYSICEEDRAYDALHFMKEKKITTLMVVNSNNIITGVLDIHNIL